MHFTAEVQGFDGGGHGVEVPSEIAASFVAKRPAVVALIEGVEYRSRLAVYGGRSYLGLRKDLLAAIDATVGDCLDIELTEDVAPRVVEEPAELVAALAANPQARTAYDGWSFTKRREAAIWVGSAKRAETRLGRAQQTVEKLLS